MIDITQYSPSTDLLSERVIAVTGAGSGIGRTLALTYAQYGATVILMGRTTSKLEAVYDKIEQQGLPQAAILPIDFATATERDYQNIASSIDAHFGRLDGLVNNAALLGERTSIGNYSLNSWQQVMTVNVTAPFLLVKTLLPLLHKSESGAIIFTGSSVGIKGRAYWGAYAASKAANENLMQTLADEQEGVSALRVNSINPGATRTPMRAAAYPAEDPNTVKPAEDLIPLYLYLMGQDSAGINGQQFKG